MTSYEIKVEMMKAKVKQYEVAETLGYSEAVFSRKLRKGLSKDEIKQVLEIINKIAGELANDDVVFLAKKHPLMLEVNKEKYPNLTFVADSKLAS